MLLFFGITLWTMSQQAENIAGKSDQFSSYVSQREAIQKRVKDASNKLTAANGEFDEAVDLLKKRNNLIAFYSLFKSCIPDNVWLTEFSISNAPSNQIKTATAQANATGILSVLDLRKRVDRSVQIDVRYVRDRKVLHPGAF